MPACSLIGIVLTFCGLIYIFLRRSQNSDTVTNIEVKDFKLKGGTGSILIVLGVLLIIFDNIFLPVYPEPEPTEPELAEYQLSPSAEIEKVWVEHNIWEGGSLGMRVHTKFNTYNLKDEDCEIVAYFYDDFGEALQDSNQEYYDDDGYVASNSYFTPSYVETTYSDTPIFLPYEELHLSQGSYNLICNVEIWHDGNTLAESEGTYFNYVQP